MTISLVAVFIPVLFMGGMLGRLLHEFAVTIDVADLDLRRGLADTHADALQPFPASACKGAARQALPCLWSASSMVCSHLYERTPEDDPAIPAHHHDRFVCSDRCHRGDVRRRCRWGSFRARTSARSSSSPKEPRGLLRGHDANTRRNWRRSFARNRTLRHSCRRSGRAVPGRLQFRLHVHEAETAPRAEAERGSDHSGASGPNCGHSRHPGFMQNPPPIRLEATLTKSQYQFILQSPDTEDSTEGRRL